MTTTKQSLLLIGKPNAGKSTLFNILSETQAATGNRSGVTVEERRAPISQLPSWHVTDLPGIDFYDTELDGHPVDQKVTLQRLKEITKSCLIANVIDATKLHSQLYLTLQLIELGHRLVIILTHGNNSQKRLLTQKLGCQVYLAKELDNHKTLESALVKAKKSTITNIIRQHRHCEHASETCLETTLASQRFLFIQSLGLISIKSENSWTEVFDTLTLNRFLGLPIFFSMMFITFWVTVVLGSLISPVIEAFMAFCTHGLFWPFQGTIFERTFASLSFALVTISSFIAPLGLLYMMLGLLEESGYMQRAACVIDRGMQKLKLPGQSFIPIIVGFGCNVPAIMSSRTIHAEHDRIQTILMSPFMSCSARLAIFSVFASSFFGSAGGGHAIIFMLYILGFMIALMTGFVVRYVLGSPPSSCLIQEVAPYKKPSFIAIAQSSGRKIIKFISKAGTVIIPSTLAIHFLLLYLPSVLTGQWANYGAAIFSPMGLSSEQAPAILSLLAGILAKEVVIGVLEAFQFNEASWLAIDPHTCWIELQEAVHSLFEGLQSLTLFSPFSVELSQNTPTYLHEIFPCKHSAISYMIFVLLYFPCLSVTATIAKESHRLWALFSSVWSTAIAYICAVLYYQLFGKQVSFLEYSLYLCLSVAVLSTLVFWLKSQVQKLRQDTIPLRMKIA